MGEGASVRGREMQINCHKVQLVVATCNMQKSSTNFDCRAANEEKEKGKRKRESGKGVE